ncbi:MAG: hypothetical protein JKY86_03770 [Gammaproteobacteria bacterium]|nr:hypothetical protein [Gammaproteobacteria bacterium]
MEMLVVAEAVTPEDVAVIAAAIAFASLATAPTSTPFTVRSPANNGAVGAVPFVREAALLSKPKPVAVASTILSIVIVSPTLAPTWNTSEENDPSKSFTPLKLD